MACRLFGTKLLSEPMMTHCCQLNPKEQISIKYYNSKVFIQENAFENIICKMAAISGLNVLTYCGPVMPYGDIDVGQDLLR